MPKTSAEKRVYDKQWLKDHPAKTKEYSSRSHKKNPEANKAATRASQLRLSYNLTPAQYDAMLTDQGGVCAVCKKPEGKVFRGKVTRLAVDHDHETGKVRQLLCNNCNMALGLLQEDHATITCLADYLLKHKGE